jgi:ATP:corrinoid adenosyltransferase
MRQADLQTTGEEPLLGRGYVHVYTGDGKGKTTAALGLALRAIGSGLRVALVMFMKNRESGEFKALEMVVTGRYAHPEVIASADLVTEMREVKHYYHSGVKARPGIDM